MPVGMVDDDSSRKISATVMKYKNQNDKGKSKKSLCKYKHSKINESNTETMIVVIY